jgi:hypothetical protein
VRKKFVGRRYQLWPTAECRRVALGDDLPGTPAG